MLHKIPFIKKVTTALGWETVNNHCQELLSFMFPLLLCGKIKRGFLCVDGGGVRFYLDPQSPAFQKSGGKVMRMPNKKKNTHGCFK